MLCVLAAKTKANSSSTWYSNVVYKGVKYLQMFPSGNAYKKVIWNQILSPILTNRNLTGISYAATAGEC